MWHVVHTAMIVSVMAMHCVTSVSGTIAVVRRSPSFEATSSSTRIAIVKVVFVRLLGTSERGGFFLAPAPDGEDFGQGAGGGEEEGPGEEVGALV